MTEPVPSPAAARTGPFAFLPDDPTQRILTIGGIAVALLLLLFVASRLLLGGGGGDEAATTTTVPGGPTATPSTTRTTARPAESFEVFSTKNPFTPLVSPPGAGGTTPATTRPGGTGTTLRPGTATSTTLRGGTTQTTVQRSQGGRATEPRRADRVALLDVFTRRGRVVANVRVNDTVHTVGEGDTFAGNYRVVSLSASTECGRFLFGDTQFRLCRGEETLK